MHASNVPRAGCTRMAYTSISDNVAWGVRWGLYYAAAFTAIASVISVLRLLVGSEPLSQKAVSFVATIAIYWLGGVAGGAIMGLLRGLLTGCIGAAFVGVVASVPAAFALRIALYGLHDWTQRHIVTTVGIACIWGTTMSLALWFTRDR